jgi:8-oxo-dGTP pyrophosphatase MutT (NUDIX family)
VTSEAPLYERDPGAWEAYLAEGNAKQARKRVGADVILRDGAGRLLLVDPRYKPDWDLPGGMAEANEAPHEAARRELKEELGHDLQLMELLCVEWVPPHGPWDDSLMFVFNGGQLTDDQIASLKIVDGELAEFRFCTSAEAAQMLRPYVWRRVQAALDGLNKGRVQYLDGSELSAS